MLEGMARQKPVDYAGAAGRTTLEKAAQLGPRFVLQPKHDGALARVHLDGRGRIDRVFQRSGREFGPELVGHLKGALVGRPDSVLVGELEAYSERSTRAAATRGWRLLHLFDCIRDGREYLARAPYEARRAALCSMRDEAEASGRGLPWAEDELGRAHSLATGRYVEAVPTDWRLTPIVEQRPAQHAQAAWADWVAAVGGEGLVAVALDAPVGARGAKRKIKATDTLDCRVVRNGGEGVIAVEYGGTVFPVSARARGDAAIAVGDVVEVATDGWWETAVRPLPKNPRLVRRRVDLLA